MPATSEAAGSGKSRCEVLGVRWQALGATSPLLGAGAGRAGVTFQPLGICREPYSEAVATPRALLAVGSLTRKEYKASASREAGLRLFAGLRSACENRDIK